MSELDELRAERDRVSVEHQRLAGKLLTLNLRIREKMRNEGLMYMVTSTDAFGKIEVDEEETHIAALKLAKMINSDDGDYGPRRWVVDIKGPDDYFIKYEEPTA